MPVQRARALSEARSGRVTDTNYSLDVTKGVVQRCAPMQNASIIQQSTFRCCNSNKDQSVGDSNDRKVIFFQTQVGNCDYHTQLCCLTLLRHADLASLQSTLIETSILFQVCVFRWVKYVFHSFLERVCSLRELFQNNHAQTSLVDDGSHLAETKDANGRVPLSFTDFVEYFLVFVSSVALVSTSVFLPGYDSVRYLDIVSLDFSNAPGLWEVEEAGHGLWRLGLVAPVSLF